MESDTFLPKVSNPQQIYEIVGDLIFSSCFDSGNLAKVSKRGPNYYDLWISPDCAGQPKENKYKTWFYFSVSKAPKDSTQTFCVKNMNFQSKLYKEGMLPVYRNSSSKLWQKINHPIVSMETNDKFFEVAFKHSFETRDETVFFAFTYPWSYSDNMDFIDYLEEKACAKKNLLFFHREILSYSLENRKIELLTITSPNGASSETEKILPNLFPEKDRPKIFEEKKYVLITARVHPGEIPSSHVLNGLLKSLIDSSDSPIISSLLFSHVFLIIPLLNPDGVYRGHYRTDPQGLNLNRFYLNPNPLEHPSIYGAKEVATYLNKRLTLYIDLHAHASKKGAFIFGNSLEFKTQVENLLFAKLLSLTSRYFDFEGCDFSQKNMFAREKGDEFSKEGSGRVAMYKAIGIVNCYTLECNYNGGFGRVGMDGKTLFKNDGNNLNEYECLEPPEKKLIRNEVYNNNPNDFNNFVEKKHVNNFIHELEDKNSIIANKFEDKIKAEEKPLEKDWSELESVEILLAGKMKKDEQILFDIESYEEIGRGILMAIKAMWEVERNSFLKYTPYGNIKNLKLQIAFDLIKQIPFRFESGYRKLLKNFACNTNVRKSLKELVGLMEKEKKIKEITAERKFEERKKSNSSKKEIRYSLPQNNLNIVNIEFKQRNSKVETTKMANKLKVTKSINQTATKKSVSSKAKRTFI